ncbi:MAG: hypothetical protein E6Q83_10305 [Thiothrix sp.]|nr:MAG: hypothetical protein E6Q83_10305 [Thiothrix sp.]
MIKNENEAVKAKQLEIMQRQLEQKTRLSTQVHAALKLGFLLTFLMYLAFNQHLYLGDALSWSAYFKDAAAIFGFAFMVVIVLLMAWFLAWVKHIAYLHFSFYGSVALVLTTVIGFALFAEFYSSSANQDVKANVLVENNSAYQSTLKDTGTVSAPNTSLIEAIANAEQKLARCESNLKAGKEKHCNGDKAKVEALRNSEQSANKAHAQASIERDKLKYERQDELKANSYNPVIVMMAQFMAAIAGSDYKDFLKSAVVFSMLIVAVVFEILHHFLSKANADSMQSVESLELAIAKYGAGTQTINSYPTPVNMPVDTPEKQPIGFGMPTPSTATATAFFKYQQPKMEAVELPKMRSIGFVDWDAPNTPKSVLDTVHARSNGAKTVIPETVNEKRSDTVHGRSTTVENQDVLSSAAERLEKDLYPQWVAALQAGNINQGARDHKQFMLEHTYTKGADLIVSMAEIERIRKRWNDRALGEGILVPNPNYTNGKAKFILA